MQTVSHHHSSHTFTLSFLVHTSNWLETHPKAMLHAGRTVIMALVIFTLLNTGIFTATKNRTPAFIKVDGYSYSNLSLGDAKQNLRDQYKTMTVTVKSGEKMFSFDAAQAGVAINPDKTLASISNHSGWQRIPVVSTLHNMFRSLKPVFDINHEALATKLAPSIASETVLPKDANISVPAERQQAVTIMPEVTGHDMNAAIAAEEVAIAITKGDMAVAVSPKLIEATWTAGEVQKFMPTVTASRDTSLTLDSDGKQLTIDPATLAPMLKLRSEGNTLKLTLDKTALENYLSQQAKVFYVASAAAHATEQDGKEIARVPGQSGQQLDAAATAEIATTAFENGVLTVTPKIASITPETLVTKTYSNTNEGLYNTIKDFAESHKGKYYVAAVELNGPGNRSAFYNAESAVITASTFKTFVAYGILQDIERGKIAMDTQTSQGSVADCMYKMIHISDNACAAALQSKLGYQAFQTRLKADGFPNTDLITTATKDKHSTARDEMALLTKLYNHELINEESLKYLLDLMGNQVYRSGIPAGSSGAHVADKVGFLYALNHDIGIVYSPKATYALVILTDGAGGWTNVRLLSQQVYDFYNQ